MRLQGEHPRTDVQSLSFGSTYMKTRVTLLALAIISLHAVILWLAYHNTASRMINPLT